jgi:hypothetical protein
MRGRICNLQLLLGLASPDFVGSEFRGTHDQILLSQIWDSPNVKGHVPVLVSPRNKVGQLYPQALGLSNSFTCYYMMYPYWTVKVKVKVILRTTVSRPGVRHPFGTRDQFFSSSFNYFRQLWVYWCGAPTLTRSRVCSFQFLLVWPAQPFSGPKGLISIFYCLYFCDSPNLEVQVPVFISPRNRVTQLYPPALGLSN